MQCVFSFSITACNSVGTPSMEFKIRAYFGRWRKFAPHGFKSVYNGFVSMTTIPDKVRVCILHTGTMYYWKSSLVGH